MKYFISILIIIGACIFMYSVVTQVYSVVAQAAQEQSRLCRIDSISCLTDKEWCEKEEGRYFGGGVFASSNCIFAPDLLVN